MMSVHTYCYDVAPTYISTWLQQDPRVASILILSCSIHVGIVHIPVDLPDFPTRHKLRFAMTVEDDFKSTWRLY